MLNFQKIYNFNKKCSSAFWTVAHFNTCSAYAVYCEEVKKNIQNDMLIYDIGGGKYCPYYDKNDRIKGVRVIGLDISDAEISVNDKIDEKIVCDVTKEIPLPYGTVDMITSRSVLEHLVSQEMFFENAAASLKPGGLFIHVFPSKFAIFAIINQLLPPKVRRKVLFALHPESKKVGGFPAYYDQTFSNAIKKLLQENNFELIAIYYQYNELGYFSFFFPFYLLCYIWNLLCYLLHLENLCSYICFVARKTGE